MKKISALLLVIIIAAASWGEETDRSFHLSFEGGIGSALNFYASHKTDTMTGYTDNPDFTNIPLYINLSGLYALYSNFQITLTAADLFNFYTSSGGNLMLNTIQLYPSIRYDLPFMEELFLETGWGFALLIPSTQLSYNGSLEPGSTFQASVIYRFTGIKKPLLPEAGFRFSRTELLSSEITSLILFFNIYLK